MFLLGLLIYYVMKLLGIDIDYQLNFEHIKDICRKASQQLNVLKRIGCFLPKLNKLTIFHSFILSNLNLCPLAWHFCSKANTIRERPFNLKEGGYGFFLKKYSDSQCC